MSLSFALVTLIAHRLTTDCILTLILPYALDLCLLLPVGFVHQHMEAAEFQELRQAVVSHDLRPASASLQHANTYTGDYGGTLSICSVHDRSL